MRTRIVATVLLFVLCSIPTRADKVPVKLASLPALSPDGETLVFEYSRDLWRVSSEGGRAKRLTSHPAFDTRPVFSPDGEKIAFASKREDSWQTFIMPANGGAPRQVTFHTEGSSPLAWFPDGEHLLVRGDRDYRGHRQTRFFKVSTQQRSREKLLFNAYGGDASLSHDGKKILFTRRGARLYRKGYEGSASSRIWMYDLISQTFTNICKDPSGCRSPLWDGNNSAFYFVTERDGCFNVWHHDLESGEEVQITDFEDNSVIIPNISRDGSTMVFRQLFDFYRLDPEKPQSLEKLEIWIDVDDSPRNVRRRWYNSVWNNDSEGTVDFTDDGLEICFTTGGDLWVMDTVLREPKLVCGGTATHEREAVFSPDQQAIYFLRDNGIGVNIWKATRKDENKYWWENDGFDLTRLTDDRKHRFNLGLSPSGERLSVVEKNFELWTYDLDMGNGRKLIESPFKIYYDWAPDGNWLVCSMRNIWGNSDVYIVSETKSRGPYNLSRHPNWDSNARWSPNGRIIAFTGKRFDEERDIFYVYLREKDALKTERDRRLAKARKSMGKKRGAQPPSPPPEKREQKSEPDEQTEQSLDNASNKQNGNSNEKTQRPRQPRQLEEHKGEAETPDSDKVEIDFEGLADRVHRLPIPNAKPSRLFWSYDSNALAFQCTINGKHGTYKLVFPDNFNPMLMTRETGTQARWIEDGSRILWLNDNVPAALDKKYPFKVFQKTNISEYKRLAFRIIWRTMRDQFYDPALNNKDWEEIRLKYEDMAANSGSWDNFDRVVAMLLGELNASHLNFDRDNKAGEEWYDEYSSGEWKIRTGHLGLRFERDHAGTGLKVARIIPEGPCDSADNAIQPGDIVTHIDGVKVDPQYDLTKLLNGRDDRTVDLQIRKPNGKSAEFAIELQGYGQIRNLVSEAWVDDMRKKVEDLSNGKLGYLHVESMNKTSLRRFEKEVYACGVGRDGLIIDVRNNPGGFTADQLLSILCHPDHAFTVPRNGDVSYQQSYLNTSIWTEPIVVLCNQFTGSNAEIFCHAIQTLGRGKIVGVPTRGAVISTPKERILDVGMVSVPRRGWFLPNGIDMEHQACIPDIIVPVAPGAIPAGKDPQLEKAIQVLEEEIKADESSPEPSYASEVRKTKKAK